jgi:hypothetical protein
MNFRHAFIFLLMMISVSAHAFELIVIQAVSDTKRTFVTRNGKRQGLIQGLTGTFTAEDVSVLAKVISVTGNFAQWELVNPNASLPFEKGTIVTYYPAQEYIWALTPESERRKYIKSEVPKTQSSLVFKGAFSRGLNESVSDAPADVSTRGSYMGEVYYEKDITPNLAFDIGVRHEREVVNYPAASFVTRRTMLITDIIYYFDNFKEYLRGRLFLAAGVGYGLSNTSTIGISQSGVVGLLPAAKIGLSMPFDDTWEFVTDAAFETLQTKEEQAGGRIQTTNQANFRFGFGLRRFF